MNAWNEGVFPEPDSHLALSSRLWGRATPGQVPMKLSICLCRAWKLFTNLCLQTGFNDTVLHPPYPLTPKELLHSARKHRWYLVLLNFVWAIKAQTSTSLSLKTLPDISNSVVVCWLEVGALQKPFSFVLTSLHLMKETRKLSATPASPRDTSEPGFNAGSL